MSDEPTVITPYRDGPLLVRGPFALRTRTATRSTSGAHRRAVPLRAVALRPFCDGTHKLVGFHGAERAERRER